MRKAVTLPSISRSTHRTVTTTTTTPFPSTLGLYRSVFIANFGGFLVGFHFALFSGVLEMPHFAKTIGKQTNDVILPVSPMTKSLVTAAFIISMALTAPFCGPLIDRLGRRTALHAMSFLFAISSIITLYAKSVLHIILTRLLAGLAYAIAIVVIPLYTSEISPPEKRGQLVNLYPIMLGVGILVAQLCNIFMSHAKWTDPVAFSVLPAVLLGFGVFTGVPESPVWTAVTNNALSSSVPITSAEASATSKFQHHHRKQPRRSTQSAFNVIDDNGDEDGDDDDDVVDRMSTSTITDSSTIIEIDHKNPLPPIPQSKLKQDTPTTLWGILHNRSSRYRLGIGVGLAISQQLTGINAVFFFAPTIMNEVLQLKGTDASLRAATAVGIANLLSCIIANTVVESTGRRRLLLLGAPPMAISLICMGAMRENILPKHPVLGVGCLLVYVFAYSVTYGPVAILVSSEMFPPKISGTCFSVCMGAFGLLSAAIGMSFLFVLEAIGGAVFLIFAVCLGFTSAFVWFLVPETKGLTLQQIDQLLDRPTTGVTISTT